MKGNIEPSKVFDEVFETLKGIDFKSIGNDLTKKEISDFDAELIKCEIQAYKAKLGLKIDAIYKKQPDILSRDLVLKVLAYLPADIEKSFLPVLTDYILEEWEVINRKMAA